MSATVQGRISGCGLALHYQPHRSAEQVAADDYRTRAADATAHARAIEKAKALINAREIFGATDEECMMLGLIPDPDARAPEEARKVPRDKHGHRVYLRICANRGLESKVKYEPKPGALCVKCYRESKKAAA